MYLCRAIMNISELLEKYQNDPRINALAEKLRTTATSRFFLKGMSGSFGAFVGVSLYKLLNHHHVFVLSDKEEAAYFHNTLQQLLDKKDIHFFPDSFRRPGKLEQINPQHILLRAEAMNRLVHKTTRAEIIVTYPEALTERVVKKEVLQQNVLHVRINEQLEVDFMIELLGTYDFEQVDFVYEPGTFSIRGDIVDIFSYGNERPYRIELFGNRVESIRTFDPESQLSEKKIAQVTIVPDIQRHFKAEQKTSFWATLPENTVLWIANVQMTAEIIQRTFDAAEQVYMTCSHGENNSSTAELSKVFEEPPSKIFDSAVDFFSQLERFPVIEWDITPQWTEAEKITFNTSPQPSIHKNFTLLVEHLNNNQQQGITTYIFADNPKQIERLYQIFDDLGAEALFHPIYCGLHEGFIDYDTQIACYTDHQIFDRYHKYHIREGYSRSKAQLIKTLRELQPGDYVTHINFGIGIFSGLEKIEVNGQMQEAVRIVYRDNDLLYVSINSLHKISKYVGKEGTTPKISRLGSDAWETLKRKAKKQIKDIASQLIQLYAQRKAQKGYAFSPDNYLQHELEASFMYEDTPDQIKATADLKRDMEAPVPMDRLVCGDVGFGKTEIAIRAAFKAVCDSKQVAVLVPTTLLSMQHWRTFTQRMEGFPVTIDYINRFKTVRERKDTLKKLASGQIDIIIGTHALLGKEVKFKDLGLLIIDEEQKFGVAAKEKLRHLKTNVDTLTLTATPIPRTLQFSLMGARDLSVIRTPPPNRQPIQTEVHTYNDEIIRDAIEFEVFRGGQVFFVHNRVKDIYEIAQMLQQLCPRITFGVAHGQMEGRKLEEAMLKFINREYDVLVCTNIVESGLDVPNANTIIINNAHMFGLSELHQLRGRVGRSNKKAFCYLFSPPLSSLTAEARKRLRTIEEFSDLGSGLHIALRDLDIRGAGNLLGAEQSGFIAEIGFDMYQKILDEAIRELKTTEYKDLYKDELEREQDYVRDCSIETDLEMLIPDYYVKNAQERLSLYTELDNISNEDELEHFKSKLRDRFGKLPPQVIELCNGIRLRWLAKKLGFERIVFKNKRLKCYFLNSPESFYYDTPVFDALLHYVQQQGSQYHFRQLAQTLLLTIEQVHTMHEAHEQLQTIWNAVQGHMSASQQLR